MKSILQQLKEITPQQPLNVIAEQCDIGFADREIDIPLPFVLQIMVDPLKAALDYTYEHKKNSLVIIENYYTLITSDPTWLRALQVWERWKEERRC